MEKDLFEIDSDKVMDSTERKSTLENFIKCLEARSKSFLGYQANHALNVDKNGVDYSADLKDCLKFQINNIGDPYGDLCGNPKKKIFNDGAFKVNSKIMERAVLKFYAELWHGIPYCRNEDESCWGYITSMGSTEANLYALKNARDYLSDKDLVIDVCEERRVLHERKEKKISGKRISGKKKELPKEPVLFYSEETHYSVKKAARALKIKTFYEYGKKYKLKCPLAKEWPRNGVPTNENGEIEIDALVKLVNVFVEADCPIIICFNYGSPFKGAFDDVENAGREVLSILEKHGVLQREVEYKSTKGEYLGAIKRANYWFHSDGALGAAYMPYLKGKVNDKGSSVPEFDFAIKYFDKNKEKHDIVQSISMSGHKWVGAPWPCGIYMTKRKYQVKPPDKVAYIGSADTTFAGSRNGFSPLIFWDYLAGNSNDTQIKKAKDTLEVAQYAEKKLRNFGESHVLKDRSARKNLKEDCLNVQRAPFSLSVRFRKINDDKIIEDFSLSEAKDPSDGEMYNHIYTMSHVSTDLIDDFVIALESSDLFEKKQLNKAVKENT